MRSVDVDNKASVFTKILNVNVPPTAPQNFTYSGYDANRHPVFTWNTNPEEDIAGYNLYKEKPVGSGTIIKVNSLLINTNQYTDINETVGMDGFIADYWVKAVDNGALESAESNHQSIMTGGMWKIAQPTPEEQNNIPDNLVLSPAFPNPFNPITTIKFGLPEDKHVQLNIYSISGKKVRTLLNGQVSKGYHQIVWDGRNESGQPVSAGLYVYELKTNNKRILKKMLLIK